jgi:hypothetical protein
MPDVVIAALLAISSSPTPDVAGFRHVYFPKKNAAPRGGVSWIGRRSKWIGPQSRGTIADPTWTLAGQLFYTQMAHTHQAFFSKKRRLGDCFFLEK